MGDSGHMIWRPETEILTPRKPICGSGFWWSPLVVCVWMGAGELLAASSVNGYCIQGKPQPPIIERKGRKERGKERKR